MLKTRLCELLGLGVPIILAPMGTCTSADPIALRSRHENAERAVRAGLGAIDAVRRLDVKSVKLQTRVGIGGSQVRS
jgi:hypothetical protein